MAISTGNTPAVSTAGRTHKGCNGSQKSTTLINCSHIKAVPQSGSNGSTPPATSEACDPTGAQWTSHNATYAADAAQEAALIQSPLSPIIPESPGHRLQTPWTFWYSLENRQQRRNVTTTPSAGSTNHSLTASATSSGTRPRLDSDASAGDGLGATDYALNLHEISKFDTVEDFYRAFVYIRLPSQVPRHFNVSMFRAGMKPMWENFGDNGGMWMIRVNRRRVLRGLATQSNEKQHFGPARPNGAIAEPTSTRSTRRNARRRQSAKSSSDAVESGHVLGKTFAGGREVALIDAIWETLVLACIGELFEIPEVVGVMLSSRKTDSLISLWNVNSVSNPELRFYIGQKIRDLCFWNPYNSVMWYKTFQQAIVDCSSHRNAESFLFTAPTTS